MNLTVLNEEISASMLLQKAIDHVNKIKTRDHSAYRYPYRYQRNVKYRRCLFTRSRNRIKSLSRKTRFKF